LKHSIQTYRFSFAISLQLVFCFFLLNLASILVTQIYANRGTNDCASHCEKGRSDGAKKLYPIGCFELMREMAELRERCFLYRNEASKYQSKLD
jgi:hypothetical protein